MPANHPPAIGGLSSLVNSKGGQRTDANGSTPSRSQNNVHYVGDSYGFDRKNLTAYGGLLPVATMLEKLGFQQLVEETLTAQRVTRTMNRYQFVLTMVFGLCGVFATAHHLCPQDASFGGRAEGYRLAGFTVHQCRWTM